MSQESAFDAILQGIAELRQDEMEGVHQVADAVSRRHPGVGFQPENELARQALIAAFRNVASRMTMRDLHSLFCWARTRMASCGCSLCHGVHDVAATEIAVRMSSVGRGESN
jgi:hypothetical protein